MCIEICIGMKTRVSSLQATVICKKVSVCVHALYTHTYLLLNSVIVPRKACGDTQGRSQKSGDGGAKILDRKPHLLINAETGSNYYSVRFPANNIYFVKQ